MTPLSSGDRARAEYRLKVVRAMLAVPSRAAEVLELVLSDESDDVVEQRIAEMFACDEQTARLILCRQFRSLRPNRQLALEEDVELLSAEPA